MALSAREREREKKNAGAQWCGKWILAFRPRCYCSAPRRALSNTMETSGKSRTSFGGRVRKFNSFALRCGFHARCISAGVSKCSRSAAADEWDANKRCTFRMLFLCCNPTRHVFSQLFEPVVFSFFVFMRMVDENMNANHAVVRWKLPWFISA